MKDQKFFVWETILENQQCCTIFALAHDVDEARAILEKAFHFESDDTPDGQRFVRVIKKEPRLVASPVPYVLKYFVRYGRICTSLPILGGSFNKEFPPQ